MYYILPVSLKFSFAKIYSTLQNTNNALCNYLVKIHFFHKTCENKKSCIQTHTAAIKLEVTSLNGHGLYELNLDLVEYWWEGVLNLRFSVFQ